MSDQNAITPDGQVKRDQESTRDSTRNPQSKYTTAASLALIISTVMQPPKARSKKAWNPLTRIFKPHSCNMPTIL